MAILGVALLLGTLEAGQIYFRWTQNGFPGSVGNALAAALPQWLLLAALTPAIFVLAHRYRLDRGRRARAIAVHALASILFAVTHLSGTAISAATIGGAREGAFASLWHVVGLYFVVRVVMYWSVVGGYHAFVLYREGREREVTASRLEARLTEARLETLRGQLNPHFLFNTLNAVSTLAFRGERWAVADALAELSELLRFALDQENGQQIPLYRELEFLARFLDLQQLRFGERLRIEREIAPEALDALVPSMITQPLVENAVLHGVASQPGGAAIRIRVSREDRHLAVEIRDSGPGFDETMLQGGWDGGIGLANTRARLAQLYGVDYELRLANAPEGGAVVSLTLPYQT